MKNDVPVGWESVMLKDLMVKSVNEGRPRNQTLFEGEALVVRSTNLMSNGKLDHTNLSTRKISNYSFFANRLEFGDILIKKSIKIESKSSKQIGFFEITDKDRNYISDNSIKVLRVNSTRTNPKYLFFYLLHLCKEDNKFFQYRRRTYDIRVDLYFDILIPLPPLQIQNEIVDILEKVELIIEKHWEVEQSLYILRKSLFLEIFGDPALNNKGWRIGTIADLTDSTQYGTSIKATDNSNGVPVLRVGNVTAQGDWDLQNLKYVEVDEKNSQRYIVNKGDLLFTRTNSRDYVGKSAVYQGEKLFIFASYLIKIVANKKGNTEFISGYLNSDYGKNILYLIAKQTTSGMANINATELLNIPIFLPPKKLQDDYGYQLNYIEQLKEKHKALATDQELLFDSLLQNAFNGKLKIKSLKEGSDNKMIKDIQVKDIPTIPERNSVLKEEKEKTIKLITLKEIINLIRRNFTNKTFTFKELREVCEQLEGVLSYNQLRNYLYQMLGETDNSLQLIFSKKHSEDEYQILFEWKEGTE
ncbi:restriction endonuclease subunit S [Peribacillus frigoritolerans]|uniref:restriction endonuclease subunit S n=1 Tax=Peribacillus frigoritolerans TaxID=450367 RepID=UPI0025A0C24E|nr:restriction endonuclease subunit S [Peribacillus frigoritolerans]MDM5309702.1 restriction endonuclease subunit S [Peribacillus frigoritolerans]